MPFRSPVPGGPVGQMPKLPDYWTIIEEADEQHPFRLATSPSRGFLNSTFNETPTLAAREKAADRDDPSRRCGAARHRRRRRRSIVGNTRGKVHLHAKVFDGVRRGVLIAESIWPNDAYPDGRGINTITGADPIAPFGGAAFHDNKVWIRPA